MQVVVCPKGWASGIKGFFSEAVKRGMCVL